MTSTQLATLLGFGFVAVWSGDGFGPAVACLIGALAFYAVVAFVRGELDVGDLQGRLSSARSDLGGSGGGAATQPRRSAEPRVR